VALVVGANERLAHHLPQQTWKEKERPR